MVPGRPSLVQPLQAELVAGGYMKAPPEAALAAKAASKAKRAQKRAGGGGADAGGPGYREYTSPGGFRVLIGRNSRQNDEVGGVGGGRRGGWPACGWMGGWRD